ncbi:hypothetical protein [Rhodospirillum rubrum]|uniref:Uncharacterized protein n=1 Tax=Rhodospirillum rubrum (strain ATCC 11170 / ATH 1.1.1 / DSM 467 / LMG 4362 / NCIMB 8255 / S1) TaxID=269796 RepID=Q2RR26_RHORT|nr:hypothetical protein [Rhodospirillum rubrum]ABC23419.1 hypothetical protein Rru_A2622 [Rhodospirillum rubrum ATCC 11170]AEO49157.1 hypothetical protein F11_13475 [Rhodospirillum rubrum F11]MBK1665312.1 hypothetical protein [Rhodospirillum rubrum]MBK1676500.1 hypothetical protein [Rhodospirillum rubrum]MBK5955089.1 hypothetical protein [Rhodospirillum rubrum]
MFDTSTPTRDDLAYGDIESTDLLPEDVFSRAALMSKQFMKCHAKIMRAIEAGDLDRLCALRSQLVALRRLYGLADPVARS